MGRFLLSFAVVTVLVGGLSATSVSAEQALIEEITVTARKVEESLNDAPVTVSAFTDSVIEEPDLNSVTDIARFTPGLSFSSAFGRATERPVVRGQGNILAGVQFGVESGVAYFVDGMYYAGDIQSLDMTNLERVEIVKGPQSALYGRNTYSGAINFVTRDPDEEFSGKVRARGLESGEQEFFGSFGGQFIDGVLAAQAAVRHYSFDGQWENEVTSRDVGQEETTSVNLTVDWTQNDTFALTTRMRFQEDEDGTRPFFLQSATENNCYPGYRSLGNVACLPFLPPLGSLYSLNQGVAFSGVERELSVYAVSAQYEMSSGHLVTFQTSLRDEERKTGSDSNHGPTNFFIGPEAFFAISRVSDYTESTYEMRLESPAESALRWSAGIFYYDYEQDQSDVVPGGGITDDGTDNFITNLAVLRSLGWDVSSDFTTTPEVRYVDEEKEQEDLDADGSVEFAGARSFTSLAPRLTIDYRLNDATMLYGIYSEGIKPGGLNGT